MLFKAGALQYVKISKLGSFKGKLLDDSLLAFVVLYRNYGMEIIVPHQFAI